MANFPPVCENFRLLVFCSCNFLWVCSGVYSDSLEAWYDHVKWFCCPHDMSTVDGGECRVTADVLNNRAVRDREGPLAGELLRGANCSLP